MIPAECLYHETACIRGRWLKPAVFFFWCGDIKMKDEPLVIEGMKTSGLRREGRRTAKYIYGHGEDLEMRIRSHKHEVDEYRKTHNVK